MGLIIMGSILNFYQKAIILIIGYLHKIVPLSEMNVTTKDVLYSCKIHKIPVMIIAPEKLHENAKEILGDMANYVMLIDPAKLLEKILEFLK
ncbi:MAG: hypothetical protein U9R23_00390 [Candidatus Cloacimonadota bacterium]|nr:hypothetical protein [Candidatus Cloacimonadota bacterium]